ncbi:hypothetical protein AK88_05547 [Plasmodium fragile]|uniref:Schizont-infected cell agglutination extracellular alpha domain-containing protein n=1 Tax=Plasmodium fragile TaxID=5857 RepID=A0A0D9QGH3_PLAFR|nr:uncharacterized protein AK88_05547 [Plasmodium fragile]KJP84821.1 hypothetical protein AK88_05547 [Plasmodium fragile]
MEDVYSVHCNYYAWADWRPPHGSPYVVPSTSDRIICTLMTKALYFMNGWSATSGGWRHNDNNSEDLEKHIRCAIVNIFMYILLASPCRSEMGVYYAWQTVKELEQGSTGLINARKCQRGVFTDIKIEELHMEQMIKNWLQNNNRLSGKIGGKRIESIYADDDDDDEHDEDPEEDDANAKPKSPEKGPNGTDDNNKDKAQPAPVDKPASNPGEQAQDPSSSLPDAEPSQPS